MSLLIPSFEDSGEFAPRVDMPNSERKNVFAIIEHPTESRYMLLDWSQIGWHSFIVGGVEDGETYEEAAIRETKEETGFSDIESTNIVAGPFCNTFFAVHKGVNRISTEKYVLIKLRSLKQIPTRPEETKHHQALWVEKEAVINFLNLDNNLYAWRIFTTGDEDQKYLKSLRCFKEIRKML